MTDITRHIRHYQAPLHKFMVQGGKRAIEIAHRRWGKDEVALAATCDLAMQRPATYWHCLPEYEQARKAIWAAVNPHTGKRRIDEAFPDAIRSGKDEQGMFIKLVNGSTWQVIGSDRYNALVGAGVAGVVFSEWALANPSSWGYISPMMRENDGWAMFITTPRGRNHATTMMDYALKTPGWFAETSTALDTELFSSEELAEIKGEYIGLYGEDFGTAQFEQEYLCNLDAAVLGSYYGGEIAKARREGRIRPIDHDPELPVTTVWDIGWTDDTYILFCQMLMGEVRVIDTYHNSGMDLAHYADILAGKDYKYARHWLPHDAQAKTLAAAGRSVYEQLTTDHGLKHVEILRNTNTEQQGIIAARKLFDRIWIDDSQEHFLSAVGQFRREWDDDKKMFRDRPVHDWTNHAADALRYLAWVWMEPPKPEEKPAVRGITIGGPSTLTMNDLLDIVKRRRERVD